MNVCMPDSFTSFCCPLLISALTLVLLHKYEYSTFTSVFQWNLMLSGKQSDLDLMSTDVFPVETGRWENKPLEDRKCTLCSKHDIGDEFHYLFVVDHFISDRKKYLRSYFYKSPNIIKFKELFSSANTRKLVKLSSFVEIIMNKCSCAA